MSDTNTEFMWYSDEIEKERVQCERLAVLSRKTWPNGIREPKGFAVKPYRGKSHSGQSVPQEK